MPFLVEDDDAVLAHPGEYGAVLVDHMETLAPLSPPVPAQASPCRSEAPPPSLKATRQASASVSGCLALACRVSHPLRSLHSSSVSSFGLLCFRVTMATPVSTTTTSATNNNPRELSWGKYARAFLPTSARRTHDYETGPSEGMLKTSRRPALLEHRKLCLAKRGNPPIAVREQPIEPLHESVGLGIRKP